MALGEGLCGRGGHQDRPRLAHWVFPAATGLRPLQGQEKSQDQAWGRSGEHHSHPAFSPGWGYF